MHSGSVSAWHQLRSQSIEPLQAAGCISLPPFSCSRVHTDRQLSPGHDGWYCQLSRESTLGVPSSVMFSCKASERSDRLYFQFLTVCHNFGGKKIPWFRTTEGTAAGTFLFTTRSTLSYKGKVYPRTDHEGPEGEWWYNSTLSLTSALDGGGLLKPSSGRFTSRKETRYPFYRRLGGPQTWSGQVQKISPPQGFDPRTFQPATKSHTHTDKLSSWHS